ncbi:hypothetical protein IV203_032702 [Nitzschia inconspicua]|uniref:Uncharacterized protein n=1 Tax=Nitzschia inconspicua TaxID=303405 RepID=A0A9K3KKT6_9STRA|nr:hypothetical protein IV203_032702 [Nitzschia inconspicua]
MKPFDNGNRLFNLRQQHRSCRHGFRRFSTSLLLTLVSVTLLVSSVNKVPFLFVNALIFNKRVPVVDQWRVLGDGKLTGVVKGHPVIPDGDKITTSPLSNPDFATQAGVTVTTLSGSQYKLETPQASYVAQLRRKQQQNRIVKGVAASQKRGTKAVTKDMDLRAALVSRNEERREKKNGALPMVPILGSLAVVAGVAFNPLKPPSSEITSSPAASSSRNNNVATVFEKVKFPDVSLNKPLIPIPLFDDKEQGVDEKAKAAERAKVEAKQKAIVDKQQTEEQRKGVAQELKIREEEENENLRFEQKLRDQLQEQELLAKKDEEEQSKRQNESKEQNQSVEELARKQEQERLAKVEQQRKKVLELLRIQEEQRARQLALIEQQREEAQRKAAALQEKEQLKQRELELAAQRQKEAEEESAKRYIEMTQKAAAAAAKAQQEKQLLLQKQQQRQQESRALELAAKQQKQAEKERIAIEKKLESELFWGKIKAGVTGIAITGATAFAGVQFLQGSSKTQEENTRKTKSSSSGGTAPFGGKISDAVAGDQAAISTRKNDKLIKEIDSVLENVQGILAEVQDTINPKQEASRKPVPPKTQPTDEMLSNLAFNETETKEEVMLREDISPSFLVEANAESSEGKPNQKNGSSGNDASTPENKIHSTSMQENSLTVSSKSEKVAKAKALEDARNKAAEEAWLMSEKERSSAQPSDEEIKAQALEDARCLAAEEAELGILLEVEKAKAIEEAQQLVQEAVVNEVRQQRNQDFIINQGALKMSQLRLLDILDTTKEQLDKAEIARLEQLIEEKQRIEMDQISKHPLEDPEMGNIELEQEQARQGDNQTRIEIDVQTREDEGVGLSVEMVKAKALEEARTMATRDAMLQAEQDKIVEAQKAKAIWEAQQLAQEAARDEIRLLRNQDLIKSRGALKISQMRLLDVLDATKQQLDLVEIARLEQLIEAKQQAKLKKERAVALLEAERKKIASKRKRQESQLDEQERHQGSASEEKRFRKAEEQRRQAITLAEEDKEKLRALEKEKTEQEAKTEKKDVSSERNRLEMLEQKKTL